MRAVYSFWTAPDSSDRLFGWLNVRDHLMSWALSVNLAKKFGNFDDIQLVTDDYGKSILIDELHLPFDKISVKLNQIESVNPFFWMYGKFIAYEMQETPFVHIDNDVFLWEALPSALLSEDLFAQSPESMENNKFDFYNIANKIFYYHLNYFPSGWIERHIKTNVVSPNCGIIGFNDIEFIKYYVREVLLFLEHPTNKRGWTDIINLKKEIVIPGIEQYMFGLAADNKKKEFKYLYNSVPLDKEYSDGKYSHLYAFKKRNTAFIENVYKYVEQNFPEAYKNVTAVTEPIMKKFEEQLKLQREMAGTRTEIASENVQVNNTKVII